MAGVQTVGKITLITSTLGRHEPLTRLLRSLEQQTFKNFEIIIVDQNPTGFLDNTLSFSTPPLTSSI